MGYYYYYYYYELINFSVTGVSLLKCVEQVSDTSLDAGVHAEL